MYKSWISYFLLPLFTLLLGNFWELGMLGMEVKYEVLLTSSGLMGLEI